MGASHGLSRATLSGLRPVGGELPRADTHPRTHRLQLTSLPVEHLLVGTPGDAYPSVHLHQRVFRIQMLRGSGPPAALHFEPHRRLHLRATSIPPTTAPSVTCRNRWR